MSKNSKQAKRGARARAMSANRKAGNKGPATTQKTNGKRNTWYNRLAGKVPNTKRHNSDESDN